MIDNEFRALLALLDAHTAATLRAAAEEAPPLRQIVGTVDGGQALLVRNNSAAPNSGGAYVEAGADTTGGVIEAIYGRGHGAFGIGVHGAGRYGVIGEGHAYDGAGVFAHGKTGAIGYAPAPDGRGVVGRVAHRSGIGVLASGSSAEGTALGIESGGIRVIGAGIDTPTPVFVHVATTQNTVDNRTTIDHPLTNDDPNAILIVTRRFDPIFNSAAADAGARAEAAGTNVWNFAVAYDAAAGRWMIAQPLGTLVIIGSAYNVLVVKA
jgi:hypothetical protein